MKRSILFFISFLLAFSCQSKRDHAVAYYKALAEINNEILYQVHLALRESKRIMIKNMSASGESVDADLARLENYFDSIGNMCERDIRLLHQIGPFDGDSLLYNSFLETLETVDQINKEDFTVLLDQLKKGEVNAARINALYNASVSLADHHIQRIDSIKKFNTRYGINLDTLELNLSKSKSEKFRANISLIHNSVPISGDCYNGYGQIRDINGSLYTGHFKNGLFDGKGRLEYSDGDSYEGEFVEGSFQGYGVYTWAKGQVYKGEWREDAINGVGSMIWPAGDTTFGYWRNGVLTEL